MSAKPGSRQDYINKIAPAAARAKLGDVIAELVDQVNTLTTKHNALLAKLDSNHGAATDHAATLVAPATALKTLEQR